MDRPCTIGALLVLLQLATSMAAVERTGSRQHDGLTVGFGHNMIKGLKLEKLPDMDKVDISNDEFHCKYLEYYRRLYADESEPNDYYDDVSAIQVQGRVKHHGDDGWTPPSPTETTGGGVDVRTTTSITFPIGKATAAVVKSVARIHGAAGAVSVYARLSAGDGKWGKPSMLGQVTWPADGRGRWRDVDVTRLLQPRKRGGAGDVTALEILLRHPGGAAEAVRIDGDDGDRHPVLHVFVDGPVADDRGTTCDRDADGTGRRRGKRSSPPGEGFVRGGKRRRPASAPRRAFGRTDCKATAASGNGTGTGNGTTNKCCRETMRVAFADIDFDFVVEPKWFDAGLCRGRCPFKYNSATQHAYIQSLLWKRRNNNNNKGHNRGTADDGDRNQQQRRGRRKLRHGDGGRAAVAKAPRPPRPCCAANKLEHLEVLHVDELNPTKLKLSTWEEMVVVECACS